MQTKKLLSSINEFARLASNRSELVGACFVLVIIVMMVIPLSPVLLDILIAVNISATIVLVVSAMLLETPLKFSSFPAILLMTTLFRLALTISTTRQILLEADAGHIIQTFGEFVIGGNVTVGLIMFLILAIVNFLVVTKGSERVAEVAGRQIEIIATLSLTDEQKAVDDIEVAGVLLGAQPALMLRDGTRLFVGASYQGVVLDQVSESGLVFVGSTRYELPL